MNVGPNLLHAVLLVCAVSSAFLTVREVRHRPMRLGRLGAPVLLAGICALVFLLLEVGSGEKPWVCLAAMVAGLAIGAVRGFTVKLQVDHMFATVRLPRAHGALLVALVLVASVLVDIGSAFAGTVAKPLREVAPNIAVLCAGLLIGRWIAVAVRSRREPHVDLYRM